MAAIPTILKGDDSGSITLTLAEDRTYTGATLVIAYQGVTREFTDLTAGQTVTFAFTHDETAAMEVKTAPILMRLIGSEGAEETVENAEARIKVTDCLDDVNAGGTFIVTPSEQGESGKVPITEVGDVDTRFTLEDLRTKVNQIVRVLAQRSLLTIALSAALFCATAEMPSFADITTQTATLGSLYNDDLVVTNVTGAATDPSVVSNIVEGYGYALPSVTNGFVRADITNGLVTAAITNGLASQTFVTTRGYVTESVTNGLVTASITNGLVTAAVTNGLVTASITNGLVTAAVTNGLVTASITNGLVTAAITNGLATTLYVDTSSAQTLASAKSYTDTAVASATPGDYLNVSNRAYAAPVDYCWSSPDEWMLTFTRGGSTSHVSTPVKPDYEGWSIISNEETTTTYHRTAQTVPVTVDETSYATPNVTNWSVSSGASISTAGLVTSDADGVYRVTAKAANGTRYGDVVLQSDLIVVETNSYHAADVAGTGTKAVNDAALAKLNAATLVGTYTRDGKTYSVYNSEKVYITTTGAGNVSEFAVSAHILGTAAHYGSYIRWLGTQTFTAPDGTTATVTKKQWYNLKDWALEHGWSATEIEAAGVSDIAFVVCDGATAVPDGCIPYFMNPTTALAKYGNGQGIAAWKCSQFHDYALPVTLTNWRSNLDGYTGDTARYWVRSDILTRLAEMGAQNYVTSGDSGKPTYIIDGSGRTIVVTANTSPNSGPDYVNGFYIIKAFVEAMGDTLKEAN